jgi:hypothetical protein
MTQAERERRAEAEHRCPRCHISALNRCRQYEPRYALLKHPHPERVALVGDDRLPTSPQAAVLARFTGRDWMAARQLRDVRPDVLRRIERYRWAERHPPREGQPGNTYWSLTGDGELALRQWRDHEAQRPVWRCAECGHGRHLTAWAGANIHGPLAPNGTDLESDDWVDVWGVHEDSIQCGEHPDGVLERRVGERWCRWWVCPNCDGNGQRPGGYSCHEPGLREDGTFRDDRHGPHKGWRPLHLPGDQHSCGEG